MVSLFSLLHLSLTMCLIACDEGSELVYLGHVATDASIRFQPTHPWLVCVSHALQATAPPPALVTSLQRHDRCACWQHLRDGEEHLKDRSMKMTSPIDLDPA